MTYKCTRCGATGRDFDAHVCEGLPDLRDLPDDLLRLLAEGKITEEDAHARASSL